ncbi:Uncharacterised protein [Yersinia pekkanenii]|uniref:Uncharacterized protein n=1 Tax=Yersinia pekkanenii TaxID=1288385 RepID=A0A0T9PL67_9GAMM|nr:Uncharacterised protein [Yersinia pekkanenii]
MADALAVEVSCFMLSIVFSVEEAVGNRFLPRFSLLMMLQWAAQCWLVGDPTAGAFGIQTHHWPAFNIRQLQYCAIIDTVGAQRGAGKVILIAEVIDFKAGITAGNQLPQWVIAIAGDQLIRRVTVISAVIGQCTNTQPTVIADGDGGGVSNDIERVFHVFSF